MSGSFDLFDFDDLTAWSESSPRTRAIDTLQIHHGTIISYSGLRSMMDPGGRTVSANGAMSNEGALGEVVRTFDRRAFTSASSFDNQCLTVEACNTTLGPGWGISEATHLRFARLAAGMYRKGILGGLWRGVGGVIGHFEVPGTYATACPGPSMQLDAIVELARRIDSGLDIIHPAPAAQAKDLDMLFLRVADDGNGNAYFTVLNTNTNGYAPPVYTTAPPGWTKAFGPFVDFTRADFIELTDTIKKLTGNAAFIGPKVAPIVP